MVTLYLSPGACSLGAHVVLKTLEIPHGIVKVALRTPDSLVHQVNPLGRVPVLKLDDGTLITENAAILPTLADLKPEAGLLGAPGSAERARVLSWVGFLNSELHGAFRPLNRPERFSDDPAHHAAIRAKARANLLGLFRHIEKQLGDAPWLTGERFTIADAYLGVFLTWRSRAEVDTRDTPKLNAYLDRYHALPAVKAARAAEAA